ncbi:uncharacterized mitochondrial protein AtMg00810-like [Helianthus annuus]|uniref:uncharacterized mitochondrial protein AtMg00810-like n=1 Tax=Helianthus annuus TaxID=4232 RepID=UPI000B902C79|nr:uncharacterized mitochondrial protein AtMg00810-like [Helianthus annuus]
MGFLQSRCDNSLFTYHHGGDIAYLLIYVDDIILTTSSDSLRLKLMGSLAAEFAMKDLGPLSYFLGITVTRTGSQMFLLQQSYALDIVNRAGMATCNPVATPVDTKPKLSTTSSVPFDNPTLYRSLAGALQYLTFTRPDICYAVQQICIQMHNPSSAHLNALKRIIRYIRGTATYGLTLSPCSDISL